jgi:hypothetical protein
MIYVRSSLSIQLVPRAVLLAYLLAHFYILSYPSGFHLLSLLLLFLFYSWLMLFTVRKLEYSAFMRGDVNLEQPR